MKNRSPYPTDVSDEEWSFAAPSLTLMRKEAPQRCYELREMFNALRWIVRAGAPWRLWPNDFPPWELVCQQMQRWIQAGCFEAMVNDLRSIIRVAQDRLSEYCRPCLHCHESRPGLRPGGFLPRFSLIAKRGLLNVPAPGPEFRAPGR